MRHRMLLSYEALAQDVDVEQVLARVLGTVPAPRLSPIQGPGDAYYGSPTDAAAWNQAQAPAPAAAGAAAAGAPGQWGGGQQ
jgi:MoxR-like ATPase